jgi:hypothetical protein
MLFWFKRTQLSSERLRKMSDFTGKCEIKFSEDLGRYLTAARDIRKGELLVCEPPAVIGPTWNAKPCCLACFSTTDLSVCQWVYYKIENFRIDLSNSICIIKCRLFLVALLHIKMHFKLKMEKKTKTNPTCCDFNLDLMQLSYLCLI